MSDIELRRQLNDELRPVGLIEDALVDQILFALVALRQCDTLRERSQAQGLMLRATAELRRLRADRAKEPQPAEPRPTAATTETPSAPVETTVVPRSAPCPCGSGLKYKRCHGWNAPASPQTVKRPAKAPSDPCPPAIISEGTRTSLSQLP